MRTLNQGMMSLNKGMKQLNSSMVDLYQSMVNLRKSLPTNRGVNYLFDAGQSVKTFSIKGASTTSKQTVKTNNMVDISQCSSYRSKLEAAKNATASLTTQYNKWVEKQTEMNKNITKIKSEQTALQNQTNTVQQSQITEATKVVSSKVSQEKLKKDEVDKKIQNITAAQNKLDEAKRKADRMKSAASYESSNGLYQSAKSGRDSTKASLDDLKNQLKNLQIPNITVEQATAEVDKAWAQVERLRKLVNTAEQVYDKARNIKNTLLTSQVKKGDLEAKVKNEQK